MAHSEIITAIVVTLFCQLTAQAIRKMPVITFCDHMQDVAKSLKYELTAKDRNDILFEAARRLK